MQFTLCQIVNSVMDLKTQIESVVVTQSDINCSVLGGKIYVKKVFRLK